MRKGVVSEFATLDGLMEDPGGAQRFEHEGWFMRYWHDDIGKVKFDELVASRSFDTAVVVLEDQPVRKGGEA